MTTTTETGNPFGDEFEPPEGPEGASNKIEYDRWGRYSNLPPIPGQRGLQPWTRASTIAGTLKDTFLLNQWSQRQVIRGLVKNPELYEVIKNHVGGPRFNPNTLNGKRVLNGYVKSATDEAGSLDGAEAGTRFHDLAESHDRGNAWSYGPDVNQTDLDMMESYRRALSTHGVKVVPELMERVICVPELNCAGRLDRVYRDGDAYRIGDLKTQKWEPGAFDGISLAVQLAIYANAEYVLNMETDPWTWEPLPVEIDKSTGVFIWVPVVDPNTAAIYDVDLTEGWRLAKASVRVREWRTSKAFVNRRGRVG